MQEELTQASPAELRARDLGGLRIDLEPSLAGSVPSRRSSAFGSLRHIELNRSWVENDRA